MAYIGREPQIGNFQVCDAISVVNGQAAYTMQVSSVNVSPETANHMLVSLNGVLQAPGSSYTVSGSTITFASNLVTGDVINFIHILGSVLDLGVPSNDTVGAAQIKDDLISGTTALASTPADTDEFLVSDAGTLKRIDYSLIKGGITEFDQWRLSATATGTNTPISSNLERVDTPSTPLIGTGVSQSSGVFTFPSTGQWLIHFEPLMYVNGSTSGNMYARIQATTNNSTYVTRAEIFVGIHFDNQGANPSKSLFLDVTDTSNVKVRFTTLYDNAGDQLQGHTDFNKTTFTFARIGDT